MDGFNIVVRGLVFILGMVLLVDALIDNPTPPLVIVVALVLMGVITVEQLRNLIQRRERNGNNHGS